MFDFVEFISDALLSLVVVWHCYDIYKLKNRIQFLEFSLLRSESDESKNGQ